MFSQLIGLKSSGVFGDILNVFLGTIKDIFGGVKRIFSGIIDFITGIFIGNWKKAWEGLKNILKGVADTFVAIVKAPINGIISLVKRSNIRTKQDKNT